MTDRFDQARSDQARSDQALRDALKRVATTLKATNVPFALSGGYASWARGGPEPVHDADFVLLEEDVGKALKALEDVGLRIEHPPEDWLEKVYDGNCLVDLIFRPAERPVTREQLERAEELRVDSVLMPVQSATDLLVGKILVLNEHTCDYGRLFPHARALREQVDWPALRREVDHSPFARAFLALCAEIGIVPEPEPGARPEAVA
ncbi:nucleotidyltransferase family protein [Pseudonocardia nigra]|uniref:nucleotidyltransferase family protein n=1 Tax=Pseudonocardia nigra TaxID=1921578 RepID=UPI001C5EBDB7|nr:nucleotidyltransferase family protein [Pseudonocardia nigra]